MQHDFLTPLCRVYTIKQAMHIARAHAEHYEQEMDDDVLNVVRQHFERLERLKVLVNAVILHGQVSMLWKRRVLSAWSQLKGDLWIGSWFLFRLSVHSLTFLSLALRNRCVADSHSWLATITSANATLHRRADRTTVWYFLGDIYVIR